MQTYHLQQHEETNKLLGEIIQKERQIPYDFPYVEFKTKQNKQTKQKQTHRYKLLIVREDGDRGMDGMGEED